MPVLHPNGNPERFLLPQGTFSHVASSGAPFPDVNFFINGTFDEGSVIRAPIATRRCEETSKLAGHTTLPTATQAFG